jgi:hypothetical protein
VEGCFSGSLTEEEPYEKRLESPFEVNSAPDCRSGCGFPGIYPDRVIGGYRDYRHIGRSIAAGLGGREE